jgi:hypothetical protein
MDLKEVIAALRLREGADRLQREWATSRQSMPAAELPFLAREFVAEACRGVYLSEEMAQAAMDVRHRVAASAALRALAWHFHHCLYQSAGYPLEEVAQWPTLEGALGEDAGMFYLLVLLSGWPELQTLYSAHDVPTNVAHDTLSEVGITLDLYRGGEQRADSRWGLSPDQVHWLVNHLRGDLYRLGRLQFQFGSFGSPVRVLRHRASGVVVALSEEGITYRADGGRAASDDGPDADGWTSQLVLTDEEIVGHPILPVGRALQREVRLATEEWQQVLVPGQPVLEIHIPDDGRMAHDLCGDSLRAAVEFFPGHFPDRPFNALCCHSWLLDAQIQELLPPTSNIVRFQREVYLFPIRLATNHLLRAIFDGVPADLTEAPRDTSFQRALLDCVLSGATFHPTGGGCFLLPQDLSWGAEVYRRQQFPW